MNRIEFMETEKEFIEKLEIFDPIMAASVLVQAIRKTAERLEMDAETLTELITENL